MNRLDMVKGFVFMVITLALMAFAIAMAPRIDKFIMDEQQEKADTIKNTAPIAQLD